MEVSQDLRVKDKKECVHCSSRFGGQTNCFKFTKQDLVFSAHLISLFDSLHSRLRLERLASNQIVCLQFEFQTLKAFVSFGVRSLYGVQMENIPLLER